MTVLRVVSAEGIPAVVGCFVGGVSGSSSSSRGGGAAQCTARPARSAQRAVVDACWKEIIRIPHGPTQCTCQANTPPNHRDAGGTEETITGDDSGHPPPPATSGPCSAQDTVRAANVRAYVAALAHGTSFTPMTQTELASATSAANALIHEDISTAKDAASAIGYRVVPLQTATECLWALEPTATARAGQGTLITRTSYARDLVLEAPHIPYDQDTDIEAAIVFDTASARGAIFAGAERCALKVTSGCGFNAACGKASPVNSDAGHSVDNAFHAFHLGVATGAATPVVVQFHSNVHPTDNGNAMVTNGTKLPFAGSLTERVFKAMGTSTGGDVRTCNDPSKPPTAAALCGTDNMQGHASNGAADACNQMPSSASDRFIHIEQNDKILEAGDTWKNQVAAAIVLAIPAK